MPKMNKSPSHPIANFMLNVLVTPFNLLAIVLRLTWRGRRIRLASLAVLGLLISTIMLQYAPKSVGQFMRHSFYAGSAFIGFQVNDVTAEGRYQTQRDVLLAAVNIQLGQPIFAINLEKLRQRVEALDWVREAVIIRQLPNVVHIKLVERKAFALYRQQKNTENLVLIDERGDHIIAAKALPRWRHLPVFFGSGAPLRAAGLVGLLRDYPILQNRMVAARWVGGRRWTLELDHGGKVHLPEREITGALNRLMDLEQQKRVLAVANQAIDLRFPDRILLRREKTSQLSLTAKEIES